MCRIICHFINSNKVNFTKTAHTTILPWHCDFTRHNNRQTNKRKKKQIVVVTWSWISKYLAWSVWFFKINLYMKHPIPKVPTTDAFSTFFLTSTKPHKYSKVFSQPYFFFQFYFFRKDVCWGQNHICFFLEGLIMAEEQGHNREIFFWRGKVAFPDFFPAWSHFPDFSQHDFNLFPVKISILVDPDKVSLVS